MTEWAVDRGACRSVVRWRARAADQASQAGTLTATDGRVRVGEHPFGPTADGAGPDGARRWREAWHRQLQDPRPSVGPVAMLEHHAWGWVLWQATDCLPQLQEGGPHPTASLLAVYHPGWARRPWRWFVRTGSPPMAHVSIPHTGQILPLRTAMGMAAGLVAAAALASQVGAVALLAAAAGGMAPGVLRWSARRRTRLVPHPGKELLGVASERHTIATRQQESEALRRADAQMQELLWEAAGAYPDPADDWAAIRHEGRGYGW